MITREGRQFTEEELILYLDHRHQEQLQKAAEDYLWMADRYKEIIQEICDQLGIKGEFGQTFGTQYVHQYIQENVTINALRGNETD